MTSYHKTTKKAISRGFTIVELLIVIVVIGILAAISIVVYNGITDNARVSSVKNDLSSIHKKLSMYKAERGAYPQSYAELASVNLSVTKSVYSTTSYSGGYQNVIYCVNKDTDRYVFSGRIVDKSTTTYYVSSDGEIKSQSSRMSSDQACTLVGASSTNRYYTSAISHVNGDWIGTWLTY